MINVHIYGFLRKKFDPDASLSEDMIIKVPFHPELTFQKLLIHLKVSPEECGECFIDGTVINISSNPLILDNSRVALFSEGMYLLCGGQHLKGHGYITKEAPKEYDYFNLTEK
jgi:hypothetical protein